MGVLGHTDSRGDTVLMTTADVCISVCEVSVSVGGYPKDSRVMTDKGWIQTLNNRCDSPAANVA